MGKEYILDNLIAAQNIDDYFDQLLLDFANSEKAKNYTPAFARVVREKHRKNQKIDRIAAGEMLDDLGLEAYIEFIHNGEINLCFVEGGLSLYNYRCRDGDFVDRVLYPTSSSGRSGH